MAQSDNGIDLEHWEYVRSVVYSDPNDVLQQDTLLLASIWSLDVDTNGRILVVDLRGEQAFLFSPEGILLANLDPSFCHLGFDFRPVHAKFVGDESILLSNAGPWGFRFMSDGDCLGSVDPDYTLVSNPGSIDAEDPEYIAGIFRLGNERVIRHMDAAGKTIGEITLPASKFPNATKRIQMGGLVVDENHLFHAGAVEPYILKLTREGTVVTRIAQRSSWFRDVSMDMPEPDHSNLARSIQASGSFYLNNTITTDIFELTDHHIMVQYQNGERGSGYQVFTKEGELVAEELDVHTSFFYAEGGFAYRIIYPGPDELDEIPNPYFEVYRFIPLSN